MDGGPGVGSRWEHRTRLLHREAISAFDAHCAPMGLRTKSRSERCPLVARNAWGNVGRPAAPGRRSHRQPSCERKNGRDSFVQRGRGAGVGEPHQLAWPRGAAKRLRQHRGCSVAAAPRHPRPGVRDEVSAAELVSGVAQVHRVPPPLPRARSGATMLAICDLKTNRRSDNGSMGRCVWLRRETQCLFRSDPTVVAAVAALAVHGGRRCRRRSLSNFPARWGQALWGTPPALGQRNDMKETHSLYLRPFARPSHLVPRRPAPGARRSRSSKTQRNHGAEGPGGEGRGGDDVGPYAPRGGDRLWRGPRWGAWGVHGCQCRSIGAPPRGSAPPAGSRGPVPRVCLEQVL